MLKIIVFYNAVIVTIMGVMGFNGAQSIPQLVMAVVFFPVVMYFWLLILPRKKKVKRKVIKPTEKDELVEIVKGKKIDDEKPVTLRRLTPEEEVKVDKNKRMFLRMIGGAGVSVFMLSIFTKRAQSAFFGSVPGPGTVSLKDISGAQIDPAIKQPTDGYRVSEVDDASSPAYYGFVDKTGQWYILKEGSSGDYRYVKGTTNFSTNWTNRDELSYDYFDAVF